MSGFEAFAIGLAGGIVGAAIVLIVIHRGDHRDGK